MCLRSLYCVVLSCLGFGSIGYSQQPEDLFRAIENGSVTAKFIPVDASHANIIVENLTDQVMAVQLPDAIAAVPVLAQFDLGGFGQQGQQQGGTNQAVGGGGNGFGQGQGLGQQGQQGFNGGFMRIPPKRTMKIKATTVCLEHGKPEPNPRIAYKMMPASEYTQDKSVIELCKRVGNKSVSQQVAQAVAWHLANGMTWKELAAEKKFQSKYLGSVHRFNAKQLREARQIVGELRAKSKDTSQQYAAMGP